MTEELCEFGLLYEMEMPRPWNDRSEYNIYWQALEQIELGDRLGFDFVWEVEHHFLEEYSHSSAPEVFFGAVSQRTKNIRIAHGVRLLPFQFNHPIKVAEQAAVLDIISNGRVEFGLGRSTTVQELDGFSVDYERTREEVREATEIIVKAWTEDILEYDGKLMKIPPRRVVPKPIQKPHPPMWMACVAPDSYEIAGDRGLGVLSFSLNFEQVQKAMAKYRKACARRSDQIPKFANEAFAGHDHLPRRGEKSRRVDRPGWRALVHALRGRAVQTIHHQKPALSPTNTCAGWWIWTWIPRTHPTRSSRSIR